MFIMGVHGWERVAGRNVYIPRNLSFAPPDLDFVAVAGDEESGDSRRGVEGVELEIGGGYNGERSILCGVRRGGRG